MRTYKKNIAFLILVLMPSAYTLLLTGCATPKGPVEVSLPPKPDQTQQTASVGKRFREPAPPGTTAIDSAIELSKKYAKLSEEATLLRQKNQNFIAENRRLKDQLATVEAQLQQAEKELTEANGLLIDMRIELNNWKANVLGFRGEMRDAEKAQLHALLKILKVLGAETAEQQTKDKNVPSTKISQSEPDQVAPLKSQISGQTNE